MSISKLEKRKERLVSYEHVLRTACRAINPKRVLEWGPGASTRMITEECPGAQILSMEHEKKWANRFNQDPLPNVKIVLRSVDLRGGTSQGYVTWPLYQYKMNDGKGYDLIFIDGRFRFDCLVIASQLLNSGGCVIIHDTHRKIYHPAFNLFKFCRNDKENRTAIMSDSNLELFDDSKNMWCNALTREETLSRISNYIENSLSFFHARFGDAELYCTEDPMFANKRHQPKDGKLSEEIIETLQIDDPRFQIAATMEGWRRGKLRRLRRILSKYFHRKVFYHVTFLHETFLYDFPAFLKFTELFKDKKVLYIGGPTTCNSIEVMNAFNISHIVELSDTNAYYELDDNMEPITRYIKECGIVISALGWASTVLAKRLWNQGIRNIQFIDIGSVVDALAGASTRSWIQKNAEYVEEKRRVFS